MSGIFITGTDTGVGKTVITGLLARYLSNKGYDVITQKWVQTGSGGFSSDIAEHLKLMRKQRRDIKNYSTHVSPYVFHFASSPHLAASLEKKSIKEEKIKKSYKFLSEKSDFVIVEGIGGALVPLNKKKLVIDLAKELDMSVLVVAENKLGAINHTLLTIEAIKKRNMKITGVIFNNKSSKVERIISSDNPKIIKTLTGEPILGTLPRLKDKEHLYKAFVPVGNKIFSGGALQD